MLDKIRGNSRSVGTYIIFGLIIVAFVFLGVGSFAVTPSAVATVNGEKISIQQFWDTAYRIYQEESSRNPDVASNEQAHLQIKRYALDRLVTNTVLRQEAARLGVFVSPQEFFTETSSIPLFQDDKGQFDQKRYLDALKSIRMTPAQFESAQRESMVATRLVEGVLNSVGVTEAEGLNFFEFMLQERVAEYVLFPKSDYLEKVVVEEADLQAYYDANQTRFFEPEQMDIEYVLVTPQSMSANITVAQEDVKRFYEEQKETFAQPEQYKVRHILIMASQTGAEGAEGVEGAQAEMQAKDILNRLKKGADFDTLVREHSQDISSASRGGDIGWQYKGGQIVPEFEAAALALKKGELSELVRTQFGFHILLKDDAREAGTSPFEEVQDIIRQQLALQKAKEAEESTRKAVVAALNEGKPLEDIAKEHALKVTKSGKMDRANLVNALQFGNDAMAILENVPVGEVAPVPINIKDGFALVKVLASTPSRTIAFAEVKEDVRATVKDNKALLLAQEDANKALAQFTGDTIPAGFAKKIKTTQAFSRTMPVIMPFGTVPLLADVLNGMQPGPWATRTFDTSEGTIIVRVKHVSPADLAVWEQQKQFLLTEMLNGRKNEVNNLYIERLISRSKIKTEDALLNEMSFTR